MNKSAIVLALGFALLTPVAIADSNSAFMAYEQGDYARAFPLLSELASERNPEVYFRLGQMYRNGWGVNQDAAQAAQWYQRASDGGHAAALYNLAGMYHKGEGVSQNYATARGLATRAAELGYAKAGIYLGDIYFKGIGMPRDYEQAYAWLGVAGHDGDPIAIYNQAQIARLLSPEERMNAEKHLQAHLKARPASAIAAAPTSIPAVAAAVFPTPSASPIASSTPTLASVSAPTLEMVSNRVTPTALVPVMAAAAKPTPLTEIVQSESAPAKIQTAAPAQAPSFMPVTEPAPVVAHSEPPAALRGPSASRLHQIKKGETVWGIAHQIKARTNMGLPTIMAALKRDNPSLSSKRPLKPGDWLQLPAFAGSVASVQSHPQKAATVAATPAKTSLKTAAKTKPAGTTSVSTVSREIVVVKGDTLFSIAKRVRPSQSTSLSTVIDALRAANPWIQGPQSVRIGEHVRIPDFHADSDARNTVTTGSL